MRAHIEQRQPARPEPPLVALAGDFVQTERIRRLLRDVVMPAAGQGRQEGRVLQQGKDRDRRLPSRRRTSRRPPALEEHEARAAVDRQHAMNLERLLGGAGRPAGRPQARIFGVTSGRTRTRNRRSVCALILRTASCSSARSGTSSAQSVSTVRHVSARPPWASLA
jgi:hypothetical protein